MDLTHYLPKPFTMTMGEWEITSPVPTVEAGKIIKGFVAVQAEQMRRLEAGEPFLEDISAYGLPEQLDDMIRLVLGEDQYNQLATQGAPEAYLTYAGQCAIVYWANGGSEEAVTAYMDGLFNLTSTGETSTRPKDQKPLENGQNTGKATRSRTAKTAHQSTKTTVSRKS